MMHNDFAVSRRRLLLWDLKLVNAMFFLVSFFTGHPIKSTQPIEKGQSGENSKCEQKSRR
jgi:hypothetical protein